MLMAKMISLMLGVRVKKNIYKQKNKLHRKCVKWQLNVLYHSTKHKQIIYCFVELTWANDAEGD